MKTIPLILIMFVVILLLLNPGCLKKDDQPRFPEAEDTTTISFTQRGLLLDTRTTKGLPNASIAVYALKPDNTDTLLYTTTTDAAGYFTLNFIYRQFNSGFSYVFTHPDQVFMKRIYKGGFYSERVNDSTGLFYLHRKSACRIALKNADGKQKHVMLFNASQKFSKLLMNQRNDTILYYLLQDYTDIIYCDYFPQKQLQTIPVRGSTSGDTLDVEFKY